VAYFVICKGQIVFVFVGENPGSKPRHLIGQAIIVKDKCSKLWSFFGIKREINNPTTKDTNENGKQTKRTKRISFLLLITGYSINLV
jgi:hypothetical protein